MSDRSSLDAEVTASVGVLVAFVLVLWALSVVGRLYEVVEALSKFYLWDDAAGMVISRFAPTAAEKGGTSGAGATPTSAVTSSFNADTPPSERYRGRASSFDRRSKVEPALRMVNTTWERAAKSTLRQLTMPLLPRAEVPVVSIPYRLFSVATVDAVCRPNTTPDASLFDRLPPDTALRLYCAPDQDEDDDAAMDAGLVPQTPPPQHFASLLMHSANAAGSPTVLCGRALFFATRGDLDEFISLNLVHNRAAPLLSPTSAKLMRAGSLVRRPSIQNMRDGAATPGGGPKGDADDDTDGELAFGATLGLTGSGYFPALAGVEGASAQSSGQFERDGSTADEFVGGIMMEVGTVSSSADIRRTHTRSLSTQVLGDDGVTPSALQALRFTLSIEQAEQMMLVSSETAAESQQRSQGDAATGHREADAAGEDEVLPMAWFVRCMTHSVLNESSASSGEVVTFVYTCHIVRGDLTPPPPSTCPPETGAAALAPSTPPRRMNSGADVLLQPESPREVLDTAHPSPAGVGMTSPSSAAEVSGSCGPPRDPCEATLGPDSSRRASNVLPSMSIAAQSTLAASPRGLTGNFDGSGTTVSSGTDGPEVFSAMSSSIDDDEEDEGPKPAVCSPPRRSHELSLSADDLPRSAMEASHRTVAPSAAPATTTSVSPTDAPATGSFTSAFADAPDDDDDDDDGGDPPVADADASNGEMDGAVSSMPAAMTANARSAPAPAVPTPAYIDVQPTLYAAVFRGQLYHVRSVFHQDMASPASTTRQTTGVVFGDSSDSDSDRSMVSEGRGPRCIICFSHRASVLLLPCAHMSLCTRCVIRLTECPECRQEISTAIVTAADIAE